MILDELSRHAGSDFLPAREPGLASHADGGKASSLHFTEDSLYCNWFRLAASGVPPKFAPPLQSDPLL